MKIAVFLVMLLSAGIYHVTAQEVAPPVPGDRNQIHATRQQPTINENSIGSLIVQLSENLTDEALTPSFRKGRPQFSKKNNQITDFTAGAAALESLQSGLVKEAMTGDWKEIEGEWIRDARSVANMRQLAGITSVLEQHIADRYFKPEWKGLRATWQATLNQASRK